MLKPLNLVAFESDFNLSFNGAILSTTNTSTNKGVFFLQPTRRAL